VQRTLGIDLGTTNSVMAYMHRGEPKVILNRDNGDLTPSVVGRTRRGELQVGQQAKARAVSDSQNTIASVKRFMGRRFADPAVKAVLERDGELVRVSYQVVEGADGGVRIGFAGRWYTPTEISSLILRRLKEDAEDRLKERFTRAVITVPAYFGERQVAATREAGRLAGFHVLRVINEPTAAALAYGLNREKDDDTTVLVYDLGGGTFDISIVMLVGGTLSVLGVEGNNLLGGDDFDQLILDRCLAEAMEQVGSDVRTNSGARQILRDAAEATKISLSSQHQVDVGFPALGEGDFETEISRTDFEAMIATKIDETIDLTQRAISGSSLTPDLIDRILLVGGSTAIPLVEARLKRIFGEGKLRKDVNPMQCVALGAAIQSALISELECSSCSSTNPVDNDTCAQCGAFLGGAEKVSCPTCYMLSDVGVTACWKCGGTLVASGTVVTPTAGRTVPPPYPSSVSSICPTCGKPFAAGSTRCSICDPVADDQGGLKCRKCGRLNATGATVCMSCGADLPITNLLDITAKDLGVALNDGRMFTLIYKGTPYPTPSPESRQFYTAGPDQRRLDVEVFEGSQSVAKQNDLCGIVTMAFTEGLPRNTAVNVAFRLDADRIITVSVQVLAPGGSIEAQEVIYQRDQLTPERQRVVQAARDRASMFMDLWVNELSLAEFADFHRLLKEMDVVLNGRPNDADKLVEEAGRTVDVAAAVRGIHALLSVVPPAAGKYLTKETSAKIALWAAEIEEIRARADWIAAEDAADRIKRLLYEELGERILLIVDTSTYAQQGKLSMALAQQVFGVLRTLDENYDSHNSPGIEQALASLDDLWLAITDELRRQGIERPRIAGIVDRRI